MSRYIVKDIRKRKCIMFYCVIDESTWLHEDYMQYRGCPLCKSRQQLNALSISTCVYSVSDITTHLCYIQIC